MANINEYSRLNAKEVLKQVNAHIEELEQANAEGYFGGDYHRVRSYGWEGKHVFRMEAVCKALSIFDWWNNNLSMAQLKQMKKFIEQAIQLGFDGYVCFKVGSKGCANGMWACKEETTDGYSPEGDTLYHSFVSGENYWDVQLNSIWASHTYEQAGKPWKLTLKQVKAELLK